MDPTPKTDRILERVIDNLRDDRCVILIGPEIQTFEGKSLIRFVHEQFLEESTEEHLHYYRQDSLFLFRDDNAKLDAPRRIRRIYQTLPVNHDIYKKILQIPFPLIISLNPDTFLSTTAANNLQPRFNFRHFRFNGDQPDDVQELAPDVPLIYNLLGSVEEDESMVLDYDDLFRFIQTAIGLRGLPNKVRIKLREANSFLFLGFDFEKWYAQLLLQMLTGERRGRPKFALNTNLSKGDAHDFLLHQFKVEFLGPGHGFFERLFVRCQEENMLRPLRSRTATLTTQLEEIKGWVGDNELERVLEILLQLANEVNSRDELLLIEGRYREWRRRFHGGTMYAEEAEVVLNRIREDLLKVINSLS